MGLTVCKKESQRDSLCTSDTFGGTLFRPTAQAEAVVPIPPGSRPLFSTSTPKRTVVHQYHRYLSAWIKGRHLRRPHGTRRAHAGDAQHFGRPGADEGVGEPHPVTGGGGVPGGSLHDGRGGNRGGGYGVQQ